MWHFQDFYLLNSVLFLSSLDEILPGLERYGALKKEFEEYHEKLEREQVSFDKFQKVLNENFLFFFEGSVENSLF